MPDENTQDVQIAEQASDKSFGDGFADETAKVDAPKKEETPQGIKVEDKPANDVAQVQDDGDKKPEVKVEEKPKTAQERMEELANKNAPVETAPKEVPPVHQAQEQTPAQAGQGNWINDLIKSPEVANTKIGVDGKEMTVAEFAKEYPEAIQAPVAVAKAMIEKAVKEIQEKASADIQGVQSQLKTMQFWDGVYQVHPDARKIASSQEFKDWVSKQSPLVAKLVSSEDTADAVSVLDAYKESLAKADKEVKDKEAFKRKQAKDGLHGESLRGVGGAPAIASNKDQDDFDAGFGQK
jgi:hypothetical protein